MATYRYIPWILEQEGSDFQSVHYRWRPKNLFMLRQVQLILKDVRSRYTNLELARGELQSLEYAAKYIKYLQRMRLWVRAASFAWQADQLKFLKSVAGFYSDYGAVLRLLKTDHLRGKFTEPATQETNTGV
jgi:uncharacterized membrane protein YjjP (DUF1212 family)